MYMFIESECSVLNAIIFSIIEMMFLYRFVLGGLGQTWEGEMPPKAWKKACHF